VTGRRNGDAGPLQSSNSRFNSDPGLTIKGGPSRGRPFLLYQSVTELASQS
jgi:hypothetical protein